jgi:BolA protein
MGEPGGASLPDQMRALLADLQPTDIRIDDQSAAHAGHAGARHGAHFDLQIVSPAFAGLSTVQRHRLVYARLASLMAGRIHALSMRLRTPEEQARAAS